MSSASVRTWPSAAQIQDDLRGLFRGELKFDRCTRGLYASDGSPLRLLPFGVACPKDEADAAELIAYAYQQSIPLSFRGAGTDLAGGCLGTGLVVDFSVHLNQIIEVGTGWVRAQAGAVWGDIDQQLARHGRRLAPALDRASVRTLGGALAVGAFGGNAHQVGGVADQVLTLDVIWGHGETTTLHRPRRTHPTAQVERSSHEIDLRASMAAFVAMHRDLLQLTLPLVKHHRTPYVLQNILGSEGVDLTRVILGCEGTLAAITGATLATVPLPAATVRFALGFTTLDQAVNAGLSLRLHETITACDVLDQRMLSFLRSNQQHRVSFPQTLGAVILVTLETHEADEFELLQLANQQIEQLRTAHSFAVLEPPASDDELTPYQLDWRRAAYRGLSALRSAAKPSFACADVAVPMEELARFTRFVQQTLGKLRLAAPIEVRCTTGQVAALPIIDLNQADERERLWAACEAIHEAAVGLGGTFGATSGTGLLRTPWLIKHAGPLLPIYRELKALFDPKDILNPGKLMESDAAWPAWPLREPPTDAQGKTVPLMLLPQLYPSVDSVRHELDACNHCGACRTTERTPEMGRICPVYRAAPHEAASPRAKVNLLRELTTTAEDGKELLSEPARKIAGLCVYCTMCRSECPSQVDVPSLMLEAKAQHFQTNGLERGDWLPARIEGLSLLGGVFALQANLLLRSRSARWLLQHLIGLSRQRTLPRFTHRTFIRRAFRLGLLSRKRLRSSDRAPVAVAGLPSKVAYMVDLFANFHDPSIGLAVVAVLRHHGIEVLVPYRQRGSGLAALVQGDVETAREIATANVRTFAPLVRDGYKLIVSEPSAALAFTREYPRLLNSPDADLLAQNTTEITAFLWGLHEAGELKTQFEPLPYHLAHHVPCHVKTLGYPQAGPRLLELIPGLTVRRLDRSCSGMAGAYGLQAQHYDASHRAGAEMLDAFRTSEINFGSTECSACRLQMIDGGRKRTLHPVQYLALAYGLMPELHERLARPIGRLLTD